jgi:hypothetical protein
VPPRPAFQELSFQTIRIFPAVQSATYSASALLLRGSKSYSFRNKGILSPFKARTLQAETVLPALFTIFHSLFPDL